MILVDCRQGVGTFQRSSQHRCLFVFPFAHLGKVADDSRYTVGYIETRLTQAKELGESIIVDGKAIALGIPGRGAPAAKASSVSAIPDIPLQRYVPLENSAHRRRILTIPFVLRRPGSALEAAKSVLFLVSPLSSYISGHTLEVTGGRGI